MGTYYEVANGVVTKYYYFGAQRIAVRTNSTLHYLFADHLSSTSLTTDASGQVVSELRYTAWGEIRYSSGNIPTKYQYTSQYSYAGEFGLLFYNARWYDGSLGRFAQADTIIPPTQGVQGWDRYAYVNNNPVRYADPSGHEICDEDGNCYNSQSWYRARNAPRLSTIDTWKMMIRGKFGIRMSDAGGKNWDARNLHLMYKSLQNVDSALNGKLKSLAGGATFWLEKQNAANGQYHGVTHLDGSGIDFYTLDDDAIRQMNIFHEVGHLLDNAPGLKDVFTNAVKNENNPSWVSGGYIESSALISDRVLDPYHDDAAAIQAYNSGESEEWADAFANYVAGNIDLSKPTGPGMDMYNFVSDALAPYIGS